MQVDELLKPFPIKEFHPFPRAMLGPGAHEMIGPEALKLGFKKTLVMTSGLRGSDIIHKITESMKYHGLEVVVYDKVESNPKDYNVMDAVGLYQQNECDSFVSIGGGSSHDACKGARISVAHDGRNVNEFEGFNKSENPKNPPHIAVSTTAGTGSETSWAYVITDTTTDPDNPHKYVAFDDASVATLAIDDPVLFYSCPVDYTAQCGFDVLAHASEPYVSRLNFPPSLGNALYAIKLTAENLRAAVWNGQDLPGREGMMYAQYIAAQAFNSGGLGIIHSISHAISAFYDLHHGLNNAIALPRVWAFNMPVAYKRFADIAGQMGVDTYGMTDVQAAEAALAAAVRLMRDVGIPERFVDVTQDSYSKNRLGQGPTKFYENAKVVKGDGPDVDRITNHVLGRRLHTGQRQGMHLRDGAPGGRALHERRSRRPADLSGARPSLRYATTRSAGAHRSRKSRREQGARSLRGRSTSVSERSAASFESVDAVMDALREHGYIADIRLATIVFLVTRLNKPMLIEGPAGVGKTELAKALAGISGRRLLRLQCYEGQDETKALYEWDYGKQLLYTQILREKIGHVVADAPDLESAVDRIGAQESVFFSERFLAARPLLESIRSEKPCVLLIDEVDRADEALEAVLLETLAEFQVSVPEVGTFTTDTPPYVILTSNNTRDLSAALKRRCLHLFLDYPSAERELEIVRSKDTGLPEALAKQLVDIVRGLRELELRKAPSISETIDWARTLAVLGVQELNATVLADTASVVVKYDKDVRKAISGHASARRPQRDGPRSRPRPWPRPRP